MTTTEMGPRQESVFGIRNGKAVRHDRWYDRQGNLYCEGGVDPALYDSTLPDEAAYDAAIEAEEQAWQDHKRAMVEQFMVEGEAARRAALLGPAQRLYRLGFSREEAATVLQATPDLLPEPPAQQGENTDHTHAGMAPGNSGGQGGNGGKK